MGKGQTVCYDTQNRCLDLNPLSLVGIRVLDVDRLRAKTIVCPYCFRRWDNLMDVDLNACELDCPDCGKSFGLTLSVEVLYTTTKRRCIKNGRGQT